MNNITRWSPFFDSFDKMDDYFKDVPMVPVSRQGLIPPVDMYETDKAVIVETPLPGADPKNVSLEIQNGFLTIRGTSERKTEVDEKNYYRKEIRAGQVYRQIPLPTMIQEDKAEASFDNGILKVMIPKSDDSDTKSIKIQVK